MQWPTVNGAVTGQLTSPRPPSKMLRDIQRETFVTVYRTLLAERRAEAQIGGCQILQSDGLRYAPFRHVVVMDA